MASAFGTSFSAAMWVVDGVHRRSTDVRPTPKPSTPTSLADTPILVLDVADLPDGPPAVLEDFSQLARRKAEKHMFSFLRHDLRERPC